MKYRVTHFDASKGANDETGEETVIDPSWAESRIAKLEHALREIASGALNSQGCERAAREALAG
jgi:hypothetical protein